MLKSWKCSRLCVLVGHWLAIFNWDSILRTWLETSMPECISFGLGFWFWFCLCALFCFAMFLCGPFKCLFTVLGPAARRTAQLLPDALGFSKCLARPAFPAHKHFKVNKKLSLEASDQKASRSKRPAAVRMAIIPKPPPRCMLPLSAPKTAARLLVFIALTEVCYKSSLGDHSVYSSLHAHSTAKLAWALTESS